MYVNSFVRIIFNIKLNLRLLCGSCLWLVCVCGSCVSLVCVVRVCVWCVSVWEAPRKKEGEPPTTLLDLLHLTSLYSITPLTSLTPIDPIDPLTPLTPLTSHLSPLTSHLTLPHLLDLDLDLDLDVYSLNSLFFLATLIFFHSKERWTAAPPKGGGSPAAPPKRERGEKAPPIHERSKERAAPHQRRMGMHYHPKQHRQNGERGEEQDHSKGGWRTTTLPKFT